MAPPVLGQDFADYSADQVVVNFCGKTLRGMGDGTFVRIRYLSPAFTSKAGSDGLVSDSRTADRRADVEVILETTSSSNLVLSALHNLDLRTRNGSGIGPLMIKDLSGNSIYTSEKARIMKAPDREFARETGQASWVIQAKKLLSVDGGN